MRLSIPNHAISACSSADSAVLDLLLRDRSKPSSSQLWQSITRAIVVQHMSVAQRSFAALATEGRDWILGLKPTGHFRTCQPFTWKGGCTEPQQMRRRSIAEGWGLLNHGLDRHHQSILQLWRGLDWAVVNGEPGHIKPAAQLGDRDGYAIGLQSLVDRLDHFSSSPSKDGFFFARSPRIAST